MIGPGPIKSKEDEKSMKILVLNAGSSSQKICLYEIDGDVNPPLTPPVPLWAADLDWSKKTGHVLLTTTARGQTWTTEETAGERIETLTRLLQGLWQGETQVVSEPAEIAVVGHRVVHGGTKYEESTLLTPEVRDNLRQLAPFAPLHQPVNLEGIEVVERVFGQTPQVAVFDTAFHRHLPLVAQLYPGPYHWFEQGIRRYGFHGISHQYCAQRSAQLVGKELSLLRIVTCHLGNGCSLAAILGGQSIDTTMGFTPLEGLMMGSRSGSIDPGILLYLQREQGNTTEKLDHMLNYESGLKGISGLASDMRAILDAIQQGNERARLALDLYIYRLRSCLGSMIAVLGGIDVLTFAGGVGEHVPEIRARVCEAFGFLGLELDVNKNASASRDQEISQANAAIQVLVVHTEEDWEIARSCWHWRHLLSPAPSSVKTPTSY
jgi:acetate kinase